MNGSILSLHEHVVILSISLSFQYGGAYSPNLAYSLSHFPEGDIPDHLRWVCRVLIVLYVYDLCAIGILHLSEVF